jgi:hypothetical protein
MISCRWREELFFSSFYVTVSKLKELHVLSVLYFLYNYKYNMVHSILT